MVVGVFLLVMSLTGVLLVFTDEMNASFDRQWVPVYNPSGVYTYDSSFASVQTQFPGWEMRLYGQPEQNEAIVYSLRKKEEEKKIFVHPLNGKILHVEDGAENQVHRQLLLLHHTFFAGTPGKVAVFFIGVLFLVSLGTGIYIYRKSLAKVFRFKIRFSSQPAKARYSSLHRLVGVWTMAFQFLIVITGLFISGKIALKAMNAKTVPPAAGAKRREPLSIDRASATLNALYPAFETHLIMVTANDPVIRFLGRFRDDPFYYGKYYSSFALNGTTLKAEKKLVLKEQSLFDRMVSVSSPLHYGNYGGKPVKILYCFLGLMPGVLSLTGFLLWRKKVKTRAGSSPRPKQAERTMLSNF